MEGVPQFFRFLFTGLGFWGLRMALPHFMSTILENNFFVLKPSTVTQFFLNANSL